MERGVRVGERAPYFRALAAGSGREVSLRTCAGRRLVLIFHAQNTSWAAERVNRAVRALPLARGGSGGERCGPEPRPAPLLAHGERDDRGQAYDEKGAREVAREEPSGVDPAEYVLILQDWGGLISRRFGVRGDGREATVVIIDENSDIVGFYQGGGPMEDVLRMLEKG